MYDQQFLDYMMRNENNPLFSNSSSAKLLHKSPEGGTDTFGFGHKLTPEEQRTQTINGVPISKLTRDDAVKIFQQDLASKVQSAKQKLASGKITSKKYGVVKADWDQLSNKQKQMLLDYEYNVAGGLNKFPSFVYGVINNDKNIMEQEYERKFTDASGKVKRLARNNDFYDLFLKETPEPEINADDPEAQVFIDPYERSRLAINDPFQPAYSLEQPVKQTGTPMQGSEWGNQKYATMDDLLMDKGLLNPLLSSKDWTVG